MLPADARAGQIRRDSSGWLPRLGLMLSAHQLSAIPPEALFDRLATLALAAEANGFDSLWVPDHFTQMTRESEVGETSLEAYTTLAALAVVTSTLRLGTSVTSVTHRHPPILAKQIVTIDVISGGRAVLGIGWGWSESEHKAYGLHFPRRVYAASNWKRPCSSAAQCLPSQVRRLPGGISGSRTP